MENRELSKLKKVELLERLVRLSEENDMLKDENSALKAELEDRKIKLSECGSLAEASLKLSGIFEAADNAAALYLGNIKRGDGQSKPVIPECKECDS